MVLAHVRANGRRRHSRSARRRFRTLFGRCANGSCRISKRCSMTTRNWRSCISMRISSAATQRYADVVRGTFSITFCAT